MVISEKDIVYGTGSCSKLTVKWRQQTKKSTRKTLQTFWKTLKKIKNIERTLTSITVGLSQLCKGDWVPEWVPSSCAKGIGSLSGFQASPYANAHIVCNGVERLSQDVTVSL